jgi:hypothetical protein
MAIGHKSCDVGFQEAGAAFSGTAMSHPVGTKQHEASRGLKVLTAGAFAILTLTSAAWADFSYGAFFAVNLTKDYLVVAIDSRRQVDTDKGTVVFDDQCKIAPLGDQAIFIAAGMTAGSDPRVDGFDVFSLATAAYRKAPHPASLEKVAQAWSDDLRSRLETLYPLHPDVFDKDYVGDVVFGYFLGFDADGTLGGFLAQVSHPDAGKKFTGAVGPIPNPATSMAGHRPEVGELYQGTSERAATAIRRFTAEAAGKSSVEQQMIRMKSIVETVPAWADDKTAGGDIAQVIFETKTHQWRWFHRPSFCPER